MEKGFVTWKDTEGIIFCGHHHHKGLKRLLIRYFYAIIDREHVRMK